MTKRTRVLLVDDSAAFRQALAIALSTDPTIEVAGQASDGKQALALVEELRPDVITMDVMMPVMDGLEASRWIMATRPTPILLLSTLARSDEQRLAILALRLGVVDAVNKPVLYGPDGARGAAQVAHLVKTAAAAQVNRRAGRAEAASPAPARAAELIAIAASTGGPPALEQLLAPLPRGFPPVVIAQHLAPSFTRGFIEWLGPALGAQVLAVDRPRPLMPGTAYLAAEQHHLQIRRGLVEPVPAAAGELSPSGDLLLRSAARAYGAAAVGVVLTGMGRDGADGLRALRDAGGWTIAQDEETSVVFGMPRAAAEAGACREVLGLPAMARRLRALAGEARA